MVKVATSLPFHVKRIVPRSCIVIFFNCLEPDRPFHSFDREA